ncbi:PREDICTED: zinc finger protein VAR3, chloroplastic [Camelina sativa]|uniref:Zinc finger protein VAR3, chloroplastic n=1 Tax=Camelina sativa TaxID=90675 RepID=A0ABM0VVH1_CAMSA|nr:PREDICTED: zinc finger protein VAR3, chloroplastic [Camelina sativa]
MSSSRIFLVGNTIFRPHKPSFPLSFNRFPSVVSLRYRCFSSDAATAVATTVDSDLLSHPPPPHPWPEWVTFVDRLKTKGYFTKDTEDDTVYQEMNLVKDACLSFARDRYDLLRSLTSGDVQALVERGCPNLFRKTVNSSKRIRAHVRLDEGDVCGSCDLRSSCDRAYVILKDTEADARTVDVMRLLLFNALDSIVISRGEIPPGKELIHESARRLLLELVEFSEKPLSPALPKPSSKESLPPKERAFKSRNDEPSSQRVAFKSRNDEPSSQRVALRNDEPSQRDRLHYSADWACPRCDFVNFARNERCRECNEVADRRPAATVVKEGDWLCPECSFLNFTRNQSCLKCKAKGPKKTSMVNVVEMKKGDWNCTGCGYMNFASNKQCRQCREQRNKTLAEPGDWECPSCDFVNFRRNDACKKCECKRPSEANTDQEDHTWKRPALL